MQTSGQDQEAPQPQQEGQKIQTVQRQKTAVSRKFRRITRKSPHGEIVSITRIPVDEDGNQIGPQITEYEASESVVDKPDSTGSVSQFPQSRVSVVKNLRQIVRKVPVARQPQQQQQQQQQVKLRDISQMDQSGGQQQPPQQVKIVKRTVLSSGETPSQTSSTGRRIVTSTTSAGGRGSVRVGTGIRRVVTAGPPTSTNQDLPTVQLCDLPSNLTLSDINQMVADAGVGQPVSVDYIPGSRECMLRFQVAEVAAKFSQKINRRMVNMSFIRASAIL